MIDPATLLENNFKYMKLANHGIVVKKNCSYGFQSKRELERTLSTLYMTPQEVDYKKKMILGKKNTVIGFVRPRGVEIVDIDIPSTSAPATDWEEIRRQAAEQLNTRTTDDGIPTPDNLRRTILDIPIRPAEAILNRTRAVTEEEVENILQEPVAYQRRVAREDLEDWIQVETPRPVTEGFVEAGVNITEAARELVGVVENAAINTGVFGDILRNAQEVAPGLNDTEELQFEPTHDNVEIEGDGTGEPLPEMTMGIDLAAQPEMQQIQIPQVPLMEVDTARVQELAPDTFDVEELARISAQVTEDQIRNQQQRTLNRNGRRYAPTQDVVGMWNWPIYQPNIDPSNLTNLTTT